MISKHYGPDDAANAFSEPEEGEEVAVLSRSKSWTRWLPMLAGICALAFAVASYVLLTTGDRFFVPNPVILVFLILGNAFLVLIFLGFLLVRILRLRDQMRRGFFGSRMQTRIITAFGFVTVLPTVIVAVFSTVFFNYGVQSWFDERLSTVLEESVEVAETYLREHRGTLRSDALAMADALRRDMPSMSLDLEGFQERVKGQALLRSLSEVIVFQEGEDIARSSLSFSFTLEKLPGSAYSRAMEGEIVLMDAQDKIFALVLVDREADILLLIARNINTRVLEHVEKSRGAAKQYDSAKDNIRELQKTFLVVFSLVTLLLLLIAIWYGVAFAASLSRPLSKLVTATEHVRAGNYDISIEEETSDKEMHHLIEQFNLMINQLDTQRDDLTMSNRMLNERRRLTEAVLEGASAGVIAIGIDYGMRTYNRQAMEVMYLSDSEMGKGLSVLERLPEVEPLLSEAQESPHELHQETMGLARKQGNLSLNIRVTAQTRDGNIEGYVITFDDVSDLVAIQRRAAWSDVARRIAHEIKNPITPIKLSVERIRKKYKPEDEEEQEAFFRYVDTINRHATDIANMVDEFSSFARMPTPQFKDENIANIIEQAVFSSRTAFEHIHFKTTIAHKEVLLKCDVRQIGQVFTNLLKNAAESVERRLEQPEPPEEGSISIGTHVKRGRYYMVIEDNGTGFPPDLMDKIMEPYVTTREKGTGLGLAIVKKTIEDHRGTIGISNRESGGARIEIALPL